MTKPTLIIVHGMGTHTAESFQKDVVDAINGAYAMYPSFANNKIEEIVDIVAVSYDDIFNEHRQRMADEAGDLYTVLSAIPGQTGIPELVTKLTKYTTKLSGDSFFYTHWLDVLFYRFTMIGEQVRIRIGKAINQAVAAKGGSKVHVLGYSLGTSVVHDALASLYDENYLIGETTEALSPSTHKLKSVHLLANVGRVLETVPKLHASVVKPTEGCTQYYREYRHKLDPFTWVKPFDPAAVEPWIANGYALDEINEVAQLNTHDVKHYIQNPKVHRTLIPFFDQGFWPTNEETDVADAAFEQTTVEGQHDLLNAKKDEISLDDSDSIINFIDAIQAFKEYVESLGETFFDDEGDNDNE